MEIAAPYPASVPWLTLLLLVPLVGSIPLLIPVLRGVSRHLALGIALVELALAILTATRFNWGRSGTYQFMESYEWIPQIGTSWAVAVNSLGLVMILLATALVPIVILAGWNDDDTGAQAAGYLNKVLILEAFMVLIFSAFDVVLFYIAFEAMLVPLYLMIGRYGVGPEKVRRQAAMKFLLFSLAGGLVMLGGIVALWGNGNNTGDLFRLDMLAVSTQTAPMGLQIGVLTTFLVAFAIKAPMVPVHTWLPDTAAVSRSGTSVLLVGVLDKIGTFGMITLCVRLFPSAVQTVAPVLLVLAVISILWGGLAAIGQNDMMRLVSYTSVSHFGFMVLGIFIGSSIAFTGAMVYMVAHGVSIAAMFLISGFLTERGESRDMRNYVGMQRVTPVIAGLWLFSGMASVALPGLSGFVPEYMVLMGTWSQSVPLAIFAVFGVVVAALYLLLPYQRVFTGKPAGPSSELTDMGMREKTVVTPLVITMVVLGVWAAPLVTSLTPIAEEAVTTLNTIATVEGSAQ
ncbi:MAG: NADH-quinone oxidoreductase subunit M [Actinobacteria bacterium]|nr:MAG: NADH-quinone oxidoreductase subunit M [Actinomycetota bacterium]